MDNENIQLSFDFDPPAADPLIKMGAPTIFNAPSVVISFSKELKKRQNTREADAIVRLLDKAKKISW